MKEQKLHHPVSLEDAVKQIKKAKEVIARAQAKISEMEANGYEFECGIRVSDYDSFSELAEALQTLIKEHGDLEIKWDGDLGAYTYPATEKEVAKLIENCKLSISSQYSKISLIQRYVEAKMEEIHAVMEAI